MTDPITASIMIVLGKYAIDKGVTLTKEVGPAAAKKAGELFQTALGRLRREPDKKVIADRFEEEPEKAALLLESDLQATAQEDDDFAAQIKELLTQYEAAAKAHAGTSQTATVTGSGAIAQGSGDALGERAVKARDVGGSIVTGDSNVLDKDLQNDTENSV